MNFNTIIPRDENGNIDGQLLALAEQVCIQSGSLTGGLPPQIIFEIKELQRKVNSYYSMELKSKSVHPLDIDKAFKDDFSQNVKVNQCQNLALRHVDVQKYIEDKQKERRKRLYVSDISIASITDALNCDETNDTNKSKMEGNSTSYVVDSYQTDAEKIINIFCMYYFLLWKGEDETVAMLVLDGMLSSVLEGYGLWHISRGIYMNSMQYRECLIDIDLQSSEKFKIYVKFMLDASLKQIAFMKPYLQISSLNSGMKKYIQFSRDGLFNKEPMPRYAEFLFRELLLMGEVKRGEVKNIIGREQRTTTSLIYQLVDLDYIVSDTPKGHIRIQFNMHIGSYIFPDLIRNISI